jgi:hypothetical protein
MPKAVGLFTDLLLLVACPHQRLALLPLLLRKRLIYF